MSGLLGGKVAVVTGGTSGIGLAIARRFIAEGSLVNITGRRQAQLDEAATELGPQAVAVRCDVGKLAELDALYESDRSRRAVPVPLAAWGVLALVKSAPGVVPDGLSGPSGRDWSTSGGLSPGPVTTGPSWR